MIRKIYSIGFLACCLGLPLHAKDIVPAASKTSVSAAKDKFCSHTQKGGKSTTSSSTTKSTVCASHPSRRPSASTPEKQTASHATPEGRLARLTAYWAGEGDYYTGHGMSSTGIHLHEGHCAVDPHIIPYGSEVEIAGLGTYLAVDTGSAVISREAARETGHNSAERNALVIDLYFESRHDGEKFASTGPKFASITWHSSSSAKNVLKKTSSLVAADE